MKCCPRPKKLKKKNILDNLPKFTKCSVHSRFQFGLEQFVNIYIKFKDGPGVGQTLSLTKQEPFSVIPRVLVLLCLM